MTGPKTDASQKFHAFKYRAPGETFYASMTRIASGLQEDPEHFQKFRKILLNQRFLPGGRIQSAIGSTKSVTAFNCYMAPTIADSFTEGPNSISKVFEYACETMRMGGGIGYDFSSLRPRGELIKKLDSQSSGPVQFMSIFDAACKCIASSGHRRGAQMGVLRVDHPDIEEFIHAKQDGHSLTNFNISVAVTDKFMEAVTEDADFDLVFEGKVYKTIKARNLWETIMRSTWKWSEPGVIFIDQINRMNNLWYTEKIAGTNPCVTADTKVLTKEGYRRINLLVEKEVDIWNGFEWSKVTPRVTGENEDILIVELSDGTSLECTKYHEFILNTGERIQAKKLQEGDRLQKHEMPVIEGEDTPDWHDRSAYEQGFFSGDGWHDQRGRDYVGLYGKKKELVEHFNPQSVREYKISGGFEGTDTTQTKLYLYLGQNVMRPKTWVPSLGDGLQSVKYRLEWLAGVFDADGCSVRDKNSVAIQLSSKDRYFLNKVQLMLHTLGTKSVVSSMNDYWRLSISANRVKQLEKLGFNPKRLDISNNNPQRDASRFTRVVSVSEGEIARHVYCFTEPKNHSGIFNGVLTAQCGEQPLGPHAACLLGSFNMVKYISFETAVAALDVTQFVEDIKEVVPAMDNVIDQSLFPWPQQMAMAQDTRRMGLGVTGLANAIETLGYSYGSKEFIKLQDYILSLLKETAYRTSIELAKKKGPFPLFDKEKYLQGAFIQTLPMDIQEGIAKHGIRNSHLTSIAPTGTISLCADNVSSGIEPVFAYRIDRKVETFDGAEVHEVEDYAFSEWGVMGKTADQVTAQEHIDVLATANRHVDSAVSKTCNVTGDMPWEEFKQLYMQAWVRGCKGCTTYNVDGKRGAILKAKKTEDPVGACYIDPQTGRKECE